MTALHGGWERQAPASGGVDDGFGVNRINEVDERFDASTEGADGAGRYRIIVGLF